MGRRTPILIGAIAALLIMAVAVPAFAASKTVSLTADNKFVPGSITISEGDTVNFKWAGGFHDVVFSDGKSSGTPTADEGVNYSRTFDAVGTYPYICTVHESVGMKGTITVQAAGGGTSGATTTTAPSSMPYTGPEQTVVPLLGAALMILGGIGLIRGRRVRER